MENDPSRKQFFVLSKHGHGQPVAVHLGRYASRAASPINHIDDKFEVVDLQYKIRPPSAPGLYCAVDLERSLGRDEDPRGNMYKALQHLSHSTERTAVDAQDSLHRQHTPSVFLARTTGRDKGFRNPIDLLPMSEGFASTDVMMGHTSLLFEESRRAVSPRKYKPVPSFARTSGRSDAAPSSAAASSGSGLGMASTLTRGNYAVHDFGKDSRRREPFEIPFLENENLRKPGEIFDLLYAPNLTAARPHSSQSTTISSSACRSSKRMEKMDRITNIMLRSEQEYMEAVELFRRSCRGTSMSVDGKSSPIPAEKSASVSRSSRPSSRRSAAALPVDSLASMSPKDNAAATADALRMADIVPSHAIAEQSAADVALSASHLITISRSTTERNLLMSRKIAREQREFDEELRRLHLQLLAKPLLRRNEVAKVPGQAHGQSDLLAERHD